jgi:hypothetical protein
MQLEVAHRWGVAVLTSATLSSLGCTVLLDFGGYQVGDAGSDAEGGALESLGPALARFDEYRFERGTRTFSVPAERGVLSNDGAGAQLRAGSFATTAGGRVRLATDGSFEYTPSGTLATFWGNDSFAYDLLAQPSSSARVRLTVQPPALSLAELLASGGSGFGIAGARPLDGIGASVSSMAPAGDVNGDGREDFIIGVPGPTVGDPAIQAGRGVFVLFGKADARNVSLDDLSAERADGFAILGDGNEQVPTGFGTVVAGAGDVNGDGFDDVIVGSPYVGASAGMAYVVFGKADAQPVDSREVAAGNGGGFGIRGSGTGYFLVGFGVGGAGDMNGDGLDDVVVGVPVLDDAHGGNAGGALVVFGKVGSAPVLVETVVDGSSQGFAVLGDTPDAFWGVRAWGAGDLNADGLADIDIASASASTRHVVVFGKTGASAVRIADLEASSAEGFPIVAADARDGAAVAAAGGDVNGDGIDDLLLGAPSARLEWPSAPLAPAGDSADAGATDAGGDGDASVTDGTGAEPPEAPTLQGIVYVAFGSREPRALDLRELAPGGERGFVIATTQLNRGLGNSLSSGDIDGDGLDDVVASVVPQNDYARAYVVFGKRDAQPVLLPPDVSSRSVLTIMCPVEEYACNSVATGADANGDGLDDLLLGSLLYPAAPQAAGGAYLAFGWDVSGRLQGRDAALIGDAGDDVFELPSTPVVLVRGGRGTDTVRPADGMAELDLTLLGRYQSIEVIDVRGRGPQRVRLDDTALRRIPQNHSGFAFSLARKLSVLGDAEDTLAFDLSGWSERGGSAGRIVYGKDGAYYGLEISQGLRVEP